MNDYVCRYFIYQLGLTTDKFPPVTGNRKPSSLMTLSDVTPEIEQEAQLFQRDRAMLRFTESAYFDKSLKITRNDTLE